MRWVTLEMDKLVPWHPLPITSAGFKHAGRRGPPHHRHGGAAPLSAFSPSSTMAHATYNPPASADLQLRVSRFKNCDCKRGRSMSMS
uniref:Uncharacterized protein n=1 Tax=Oryza meridionalis TaxID=40149 RepID=A0A0E0C3Q7_9ORYZ